MPAMLQMRETLQQTHQTRTTSQTIVLITHLTTPVTQTTSQTTVLTAAMLQAKTAAGTLITPTTLLIAVSLFPVLSGK